jgi:hypothetical protein
VTVSILEITTQHGAIEGKTQNVDTQFYNLDAIRTPKSSHELPF